MCPKLGQVLGIIFKSWDAFHDQIVLMGHLCTACAFFVIATIILAIVSALITPE